MRSRTLLFAGISLLAVIAAAQWIARSPLKAPDQTTTERTQPRATPPPAPPPSMLSPAFAQALEGVLDMTETDAARLERRVAAHPDDYRARVKVMGYLRRADRQAFPGDVAKRWKHTKWLIEHQPDSEILHSFTARFSPGDLTPETLRQAEQLWERAARNKPADARIAWNAASFFQDLNPDLHLSYLEATAAADPNHPHALRPLAQVYAEALVQPKSALVTRAERGLERSDNVWVLGNAAYFLQAHYNQTAVAGAPNRRIGELAERYFARAHAIDPSLDRHAILPQANLNKGEYDRVAAAREKARFEQAADKIVRLGVDSFPQMPRVVARALQARGCTVPQPAAGAGAKPHPSNVIRGEFVAAGTPGWAVLCSVNQRSRVLVFRDDVDANPHELSSSDDSGYLQGLGGGTIGYSREIAAVSRDFIMRHYRAMEARSLLPSNTTASMTHFLGKPR